MYLEEQNSTFKHKGKIYNVNMFLKKSKQLLIHEVEIDRLVWCISYENIFTNRLNRADITTPIMYTEDEQYGLVVLDGLHRVTKSYLKGLGFIYGVNIPENWL